MKQQNQPLERIQINGEWYVRERIVTPGKSILPTIKEVNFHKACIYENEDYAWEATLLATDHTYEDYIHSALGIKFTDKRGIINEEYWDNPSWLLGVYHNDHDSMGVIYNEDLMDPEGIETFRNFLKVLIEIGWLKDNTNKQK